MRVFFDTETSHLPEAVSDDKSILIQLAYVAQKDNKMKLVFDLMLPEDFNGIDPEQMAVHHLTPEMIETRSYVHCTPAFLTFQKMISVPETILIAHNIKFDEDVLRREGVELSNTPKIDTLKIVKFFNDKTGMKWKSLKLDYLVYYYRLDKYIESMFEKLNCKPTHQNHDATYDTVKLMLVFEKLKSLLQASDEQLIELTKNPIFLTHVPFGHNKGKKFVDLPFNQLRWQADNSFDEDVRFTCKKLLEN